MRHNLLPPEAQKLPTRLEMERRKGMAHRNGWQIAHGESLTAAQAAALSLFALLSLLLSVGR